MNLLIVSHTHWDREWYRPFQEFRFSLVELVDYLLDLLSRDEQYKYFMLDGQTVVLEDYLEVRPERRDELSGWIRAGRLLVGPWYVLPDEFLVSGESLVRNLLEGRRVASSFGQPMPVGYIPDPFGHVAQMPQILRGFGITSAAIWRGLGRDLRSSEFWWEGLDGRSILALHLADSYSNAADLPRDSDLLKRRLTRIRAGLEPLASTPYIVLMNGRDHGFPQSELPEIIRAAATCCPDLAVEHASLPIVMQRLSEQDGTSWPVVRGELRSGERSPLLPGVLSARMWIKQRNAVCEALLEKWAEPFAAWAHLLLGEPDQREILRHAWRLLLVNHAHDSICGCSVDQVHDEMAPRFDQIEQLCERIIDKALGALARRVAIGSLPEGTPLCPGVVVFNPLAWPRSDAVVLDVPPELAGGLLDQAGENIPTQVVGPERTQSYDLDMPRQDVLSLLEAAAGGDAQTWDAQAMARLGDWGCGLFGDGMTGGHLSAVSIEPGPQLRSYRVVAELGHGQSGNEIRLGDTLSRLARIAADPDTRLIQLRIVRRQVQVCLVAPSVPACGYASYRLMATPVLRRPVAWNDQVRTFETGLENSLVRVEVDREDGSLTLVDRTTGEIYRGLNRFVDVGDAGDEYNYSPPSQDRLICCPVARPIVRVIESGPVRASMRIDAMWGIPAELADDRASRLDALVECPISTTVSLAANARRLEVRVELTNHARDHRMRVHFPTGCHAGRAFVGGHFAVLERAHDLPVADESWIELPLGTRPQSGFVDVATGGRGLLVTSRGLPEYEVIPSPEGDEIALTLLRSVGWLSRDDLPVRLGHAGPGFPTPGAQCLGRHVFNYAIVPHLGDWRSVVREAQSHLYPMRARLTLPGQENALTGRESFLSLEPEPLELTAAKVAEDGGGLIVRFYNPLLEPLTARLSVRPPCTVLSRCDLAERRLETIPITGETAVLDVAPGEIVTLHLLFPHPIARAGTCYNTTGV
ncbi:MAG: hypothetical protein EPO21_11115 [Chloroflexota bacterium]|nr:MAG: hypothetical protein EPO21_11115 [Chloroflexota bacterium]